MSDLPAPVERVVWTDGDLDRMGWHDVTVHGVAFDEVDGRARFLLDVDYVVSSLAPHGPDDHFAFLVAPATLVFENVWNLDTDLGGTRPFLVIDGLHRSEPEDDRQTAEGVAPWTIEGRDFALRFLAAGFHLHLRARPRVSTSHRLALAERGGTSFAEPAGF